jgi:PAS domain S-box-containing protein
MDILGRNCRFLQGTENYRSDGELFWNEASISPIRDRTNQITHYTGTQIDVTGRTGRQDTANAGR